MTDKELMQQALDALDSDNPDIQLRTAIALRERLAQPEQEPVAWANSNDLQNFDMRVRTNGGPLHTVPLYTTPPQRPWVGLTEPERLSCYDLNPARFASNIEAKLQSKNT